VPYAFLFVNTPLSHLLSVCYVVNTPRLNTSATWAALGTLALILLNAAFDLARGDPLGAGSFLHISFNNNSLSGPLIDILNHSSRTIILALGMSLVIAVRGVDLSVGSVMAIAGATAAVLVGDGFGPAIAIAAALAIAAACGLFNGILVSTLAIQPIVATLILMVAGRGIAQMITHGQVVSFQNPTLTFLGNGRLLFLPFPFLLAMTLFAATLLAVRKSALGLLIEAVGSNPTAAHLAGVRAKSLVACTYIFAALCAGLVGLIDASTIKAADPMNSGVNAELAAIFAAVVGGSSLTGGRFSITGALIGGLLIQTLTHTMYARDISAHVAPLPQAVVILAVCLVGGRARAHAAQSTHAQSASIHPTLAGAAILIALFAFGAIRYDYFATISTLPSLLNDYAFVGIAAIGATLIILSGGIDLSPGSVIACSSILIATLISRGIHPLLAFPIALAAGAVFGAAMGILIQRFRLPAFMVTLAGMFAARATGFLIHPQSLGITHDLFTTLQQPLLSMQTRWGALELSPSALTFLLLLIAAWILLTRTPFGRSIHALGGNEHSTRTMGLNTARTRIAVYTLAALCSAVAGCAFTIYQGSGNPLSTVGLELDLIAAAVIGGTLLSGGVGSIWGTLVGVLILALIRRIIDFEGNLSSAWTNLASGALLFIFVALQRLAARMP
jgi:galactofuranose transport system permease protein